LKNVIQSNRIFSLDIMRGLVMVLMALDHTRHFFITARLNELNVLVDEPWLFFTRWITNFCAPVFLFLAGVSLKLMADKEDNLRHTSLFLLKRGFWLIFLEVIIMNFFWDSNMFSVELQILWIFGISFLLMSFLLYVPGKVNFFIAVVLIVFHNLLDPHHVDDHQVFLGVLMNFLNNPGYIEISNHLQVLFLYTVMPWSAVLLLGYSMAGIFSMESLKRKRILIITGVAMVIVFLILRSINLYGDDYKWSVQPGETIFSIMSFLNVTKYPASLQFILITMGPSLLLLAFLNDVSEKRLVKLRTMGQVALFFYIIHIPIIRIFSRLFHSLFGKEVTVLGFYLIWMILVIILYRLSKIYYEFKKARKDEARYWFLKYL
jgi:uncharacterized membrane protein